MASAWFESREVFSKITEVVTGRGCSAGELELLLQQHRSSFTNLLKNSPRSLSALDQLQRAARDGLSLEDTQRPIVISQKFIDEVIILSQLYNLNELRAAGLLLSGEQLMPRFPGLPRGLVSIIVYYDSAKCWVEALRSLINARPGRSWSMDVAADVAEVIVAFTDQLWKDGLFDRLMELLRTFNPRAEQQRLNDQRGLGDAKHQKMVKNLLLDTYEAIADCIFQWSLQQGLQIAQFSTIVNYLKNLNGMSVEHAAVSSGSEDMDGALGVRRPCDKIVCSLVMSVMAAVSVEAGGADFGDDSLEGGDEYSDVIPSIFQTPEAIFTLHHDLVDTPWKLAELQALLVCRWALTIRILSQLASASRILEGFNEDEEELLDRALAGNALPFATESVIDGKEFHESEFFVRTLHRLFSDIICYFPMKMKELRSQCDEEVRLVMEYEARNEAPPEFFFHFHELMRLVGKLYECDPLHLHLSCEYWVSSEILTSGSYYRGGAVGFQAALFKFVRSAMDLHHALLCTSCLNMLTGLTSNQRAAEQCFLVLKSNSVNVGNQMSWDYAFTAFKKYLSTLRGADSQLPSHYPCIEPTELNGLIAWLKLLENIANNDSGTRLAFCDHLSWSCPGILFGIAACPVPAILKAHTFRALAALAKSPEVATMFWQALQSSSILVRRPDGGFSGIEDELEDLESKIEEYPVTRGFLSLLATLCSHPLEPGVLPTQAAFAPFLEYIIERVFVRIAARGYKNIAEMWEIGALCCDILRSLVTGLSRELFLIGTKMDEFPPGISVMMVMLSDGAVFRTTMWVLTEGTKILEQHIESEGQEWLNKATISALRLIDGILSRQELFFQRVRDSGIPILTAHMGSLLQTSNPDTHQADYMINIAKYTTFVDQLPRHALMASKIIHKLSSSPDMLPKITRSFTSKQQISRLILHGFVECLEYSDVAISDAVIAKPFDELNDAEIHGLAMVEIIDMMIDVLRCDVAPNLALYLLGFDTLKPELTQLEDPGINGFPLTCLHSIIKILDNHLAILSAGGSRPTSTFPYLAEPAYRLIYDAVSNPHIGGPLLRYLRTSYGFVEAQFEALPFMSGERCESDRVRQCREQAWLLKLAAVDMRHGVLQKQRSYVDKMSALLLEENYIADSKNPDTESHSLAIGSLSLSMFGANQSASQRPSLGHRSRKLFQILDDLDLVHPQLIQPVLEYFDSSKLSQVITACKATNSKHGYIECDLGQLHALLHRELSCLSGTNLAGQQGHIHKEIQDILEYVHQYNKLQSFCQAQLSALDGWRQLCEVIFSIVPLETFTIEERSEMIIDLLIKLLNKVKEQEVIDEVYGIVASITYCLISALGRSISTDWCIGYGDHTVMDETGAGDTLLSRPSTSLYVSLLDGTRVQGGARNTAKESSLVSQVSVVLRSFLELIVKTGGRDSKTRAYWYGSLLQLCRLMKASHRAVSGIEEHDEISDHILSESFTAREVLMDAFGQILSGFLPDLLPLLCSDACDGPDVCKTLSLSCLASLVGSGSTVACPLIAIMANRGWLAHLIESIKAEDDAKLQLLLTSESEPLRQLYIYRARLAFLMAVASTEDGANAILGHNVLARLAECPCFSAMPSDVFSHSQDGRDTLSFAERYELVLTAALKLCMALVNGAGSRNKLASVQILQFISANLDTCSFILRSSIQPKSAGQLRLLELLTWVLSRAATEADVIEAGTLDLRSQCEHCLRQAISLFATFAEFDSRVIRPYFGGASSARSGISKILDRPLMESTSTDLDVLTGRSQKVSLLAVCEIEVSCLTILTNLISHCHTFVTQKGTSSKDCRALFLPSASVDTKSSITTSGPSSGPELGQLITAIYNMASHAMILDQRSKELQRKLKALDSGSSFPDLSAIVPSERGATTSIMSSFISTSGETQKQKLYMKRLVDLHANCDKQKLVLKRGIEQGLFLLWRHIEIYLHASTSSSDLFGTHHRSSGSSSVYQLLMRRAGQRTPVAKAEDSTSSRVAAGANLRNLKEELNLTLDESWFMRIQKAEQALRKESVANNFIESVLRHVKRLVKIRAQA